MFVTFPVLKWAIFNSVNDEHSRKVSAIFVTLEVSKLSIFKYVNDLHCLNILLIFFSFESEVWKWFKSKVSSDEQ